MIVIVEDLLNPDWTIEVDGKIVLFIHKQEHSRGGFEIFDADSKKIGQQATFEGARKQAFAILGARGIQ